MVTLAQVAVSFKGDVSQLVKDAQAEGTRAGQTAEQGFTSGFHLNGQTLFAGFSAGAAAALGVASKGLLDLDNITHKYAADTGASQQELAQFRSTILDLNKNNLESMDQIGGVLTSLRTNLGLTQDQTDKAAQSFLDYAKATGQEAEPATTAMTTILKAWNLTVDDAQPLMDQLVASHQKYGGSIQANQQALAALAPALQASNTSLDEAIGFLNLAAKSGIDAGNATAALNHAVKELKPGQSLDDLIKQITSIQDPTERAQEAIKIFGARGGVALAQALQPGVDSLKQYEVSAGDAADATKKAADDIDSSIENQVQLALKNVSGTLLQLAAPAGPILTAAGGFGSMAIAVKDLGIPIPGVQALLQALGITTAETGAAEALAGTEAAASSLGQDALAISIGENRLASGAAAPQILMLADAETVAGAAATTAAAEVGAATGAVARFAGSLASLPEWVISLVRGGGLSLVNYHDLDKQVGALYDAAHAIDGVAGASRDAGYEVDNLVGNFVDASKGTHDFGSELTDAKGATHDFGAGVDDLTQTWDTLHASVDAAGVGLIKLTGTQKTAADAAEQHRLNLVGEQGASLSAAQGMQGLATAVAGVATATASAAGNLPLVIKKITTDMLDTMAQSIKDNRQKPVDEMTALVALEKNALSPMQETARLIGELTGKQLHDGLHSTDPLVKAQAQATERSIIDELQKLGASGLALGKTAMQQLHDGMHSKDPDVRAEATAVYDLIETRLSPLAADARRWGAATGDSFISGLANSIRGGTALIVGAVANVKGPLEAHSPPGPESPLHLIDVWGYKTGMAWGGGVILGIHQSAAGITAALKFVAPSFDPTANALNGTTDGTAVAINAVTDAAQQAKIDQLQLERGDLVRQQAAANLTDEQKKQLADQITAIDNQLTAISAAQDQVRIAQDYVAQLKAAGASTEDIVKAMNELIAAQQTLEQTTFYGAPAPAPGAPPGPGAGTPGAPPAPGTPGAPPAPYGQVPAGSLAGGLGSGGLWIPDINHTNGGNPTWQALDPSIYPTAGQNPTYGNDTTGGPTGGIQIHGDININNPAPEPASKSAKKALQDLALFGVTS